MSTRQRSLRFLTYVFTALLVFTGTALSASKTPSTMAELVLYNGADRQQILEEGARKEGKLVLYTTNADYRAVMNAFQKKYPYVIMDAWWASPTQVLPKVLEEYKADKHFFDVIETTQATMMVIQKVGMLLPFYSPQTAFIQDGAITMAPGGGVFRAGFWENGLGLIYNTKLITKEALPKSNKDLLDEKWKATIPLSDGGQEAVWVGSMVAAYGEDFVRRLAKRDFIVFHGGSPVIIQMIIAGDYAFAPAVFDAKVEQSRKKGAPVDWAPIEPVPVNVGQIALPKLSSHPHAALLFADFVLSKEVAEIKKAQGYGPTRKDIPGIKTYKKWYGATSAEEALKHTELFTTLFLKH